MSISTDISGAPLASETEHFALFLDFWKSHLRVGEVVPCLSRFDLETALRTIPGLALLELIGDREILIRRLAVLSPYAGETAFIDRNFVDFIPEQFQGWFCDLHRTIHHAACGLIGTHSNEMMSGRRVIKRSLSLPVRGDEGGAFVFALHEMVNHTAALSDEDQIRVIGSSFADVHYVDVGSGVPTAESMWIKAVV